MSRAPASRTLHRQTSLSHPLPEAGRRPRPPQPRNPPWLTLSLLGFTMITLPFPAPSGGSSAQRADLSVVPKTDLRRQRRFRDFGAVSATEITQLPLLPLHPHLFLSMPLALLACMHLCTPSLFVRGLLPCRLLPLSWRQCSSRSKICGKTPPSSVLFLFLKGEGDCP